MMPYIIAIVVVVVLLVIWVISVQRSLAVLDENINNAMSQIGVQLSSRFDALTALLDLTKGYAEHEYKTISDVIKERRSIVSSSTPSEVEAQENIITDAMSRIMAIAENYPDLKANQQYAITMDSVNKYETAVRQSRLVYNDCVTKLNRKIRMFPASLIAGMVGFKSRDYLEAVNGKEDMPSMK
ncbi:MAG: LemA family protein [Oscillospiraceae bacterium]